MVQVVHHSKCPSTVHAARAAYEALVSVDRQAQVRCVERAVAKPRELALVGAVAVGRLGEGVVRVGAEAVGDVARLEQARDDVASKPEFLLAGHRQSFLHLVALINFLVV